MPKDQQIVEVDEWQGAEMRPSSTAVALKRGAGAVAGRAGVLARHAVDRIVLREPRAQDFGVVATMRPKRLPNLYILSFLLVVVLPTFASIFYLGFLASDQYVAEARFAVQTARLGVTGGDEKKTQGSLTSGSLPSLAGQDAYIVTNYIHSRAILDDLKDKIDVAAIYRRPEADFWARLKRKPEAEELTDYWNDMVSTYIDGPSGIVTLRVRAFRPKDAVAVANAVLAAGETLANKVSERARVSVMRQAEQEVARSEGLVKTALADEQSFRDRQGYIDPVSAATSTSTLLTQAMAQKVKLEDDYFFATRAMSAEAPSAAALKTQLDGVNAQIDKLQGELTSRSPGRKTISSSLGAFEALELKRVFAERLYTIAQESLERARLAAQDQAIYVSTFVPPDVPEYPEYPQRLSLSLLIPMGLGVIWGIFALVAAAIEDHRY